MRNEIKLYIDKDYHKLHIRRGDYFTMTDRSICKIDNLEGLSEMFEVEEDAVEVWEVLGEELKNAGISLENLSMN